MIRQPLPSSESRLPLYDKIARVLGRTELHFFNQSGHYVFQEYPRETADLIVSFIKNAKDSSSH